MASRTQQTKETKKVIAKYKKLVVAAVDTQAAEALVKEAVSTTTDPIQRSKIILGLRNFVK